MGDRKKIYYCTGRGICKLRSFLNQDFTVFVHVSCHKLLQTCLVNYEISGTDSDFELCVYKLPTNQMSNEA